MFLEDWKSLEVFVIFAWVFVEGIECQLERIVVKDEQDAAGKKRDSEVDENGDSKAASPKHQAEGTMHGFDTSHICYGTSLNLQLHHAVHAT